MAKVGLILLPSASHSIVAIIACIEGNTAMAYTNRIKWFDFRYTRSIKTKNRPLAVFVLVGSVISEHNAYPHLDKSRMPCYTEKKEYRS